MECKNTENIGWEDWKLLYLWSTDFVSTCQISCPYGYICSFSLRLHKENEPKEMRFAAARFLPKIGRFSLKRENLHRSLRSRCFGQFAFLHARNDTIS